MSRASLAVILSKLKRFESPKTKFEQYPTPSEAAATILWDAYTRGLVENKVVLDLGAGTGILGIGALILGAKKVFFVEIDPDAYQFIKENIAIVQEHVDCELGVWEIIEQDLVADSTSVLPFVDLAVLNPPFGTKQKHVDVLFLTKAIAHAPQVYAFHKSVTKEYVLTQVEKNGARLVQEFPFSFDLPKTMDQHVKKSYKTAVSCFHLSKSS